MAPIWARLGLTSAPAPPRFSPPPPQIPPQVPRPRASRRLGTAASRGIGPSSLLRTGWGSSGRRRGLSGGLPSPPPPGLSPRGPEPPGRSPLALSLAGGVLGARCRGAVPAAPLSGRRSGPRAASGVFPAGPRRSGRQSTWLRRSIFGSQEAPSRGEAEPSPGGRGRAGAAPRGPEGRALGGGRGGPSGPGARPAPAPGLRAPAPAAGPSRYTRGKVFQRPLPASPRLPASPAPASAGGAPLCQTVSTLCKDKDQREEEEQERERRGDVSWEGASVRDALPAPSPPDLQKLRRVPGRGE